MVKSESYPGLSPFQHPPEEVPPNEDDTIPIEGT